MISAREASRLLEDEAGVGRQQSRRALLSGIAGPPTRARHTVLYDEDSVRAVGRWRDLDHAELLESCPAGVLVVRLGRGLEPEPFTVWEQRVEAVRLQPYLGFPAWAQLRALLGLCGRLACVATVCGYPVLTADLVSLAVTADDRLDLGLEPPGAWAVLLEHRRLVTSPGPAWLVLGEQPSLGRAQSADHRAEPVGAGRSTTWTRWA